MVSGGEAAQAQATPEPPAAGPARQDGRRVRRGRNRTAVLDALLHLVQEGDPRPRVEEIAARAGISLRSLYRYFPDYSSMMSAGMDLNFERATTAVPVLEVGVGSLDERITAMVEVRQALLEALAPAVRIARLASADNEFIRARFDTGRRYLCAQVEQHFAEELARLPLAERTATAAAADALCQLETLFYLRVERGLAPAVVARTVRTGLGALLGSGQ